MPAHVTRAAGEEGTTTTTISTPSASETTTYFLDAGPLKTSLLFDLLPEGRGQAVVVVGVLEGSAADKAGIVPGQKLLAISDPVRPDEMWSLQDRPSLRFVKDILTALRNKEVKLEMSAGAVFTAADATATSSGSYSDDEGSSDGPLPPLLPQSDVQKRIKRRKAYMDEVDQRDDRAFLSIAALLFLGPAIAILAWAYFSGYLDTMYTNSLISQR